MEATEYQAAKKSLEALPPADRLRLIAEVVATLSAQVDVRPRRSILELEGLGKEIWEGVDVPQYIKEERASWER